MIKKIFPVFILIIFIPLINAQKKIYEFESAYVKKVTTTTSSGVEVIVVEEIFITDYGKKSASYKNEKKNIKSLKKTEEINSVSIVDGDWIITYNPKIKEGTKRKNILSGKLKNVSDKDAERMSEELKNALNTETKDLGFGTIAGKKCKISLTSSSIAGIKTTSKIWSYKNFNMKSESESLGNKVKEEVTIFKEGEKISKDKFIIPKEIKIKEVKF